MIRRPRVGAPLSSPVSASWLEADERGRALLEVAARVLPEGAGGREVAGLPPLVAELVRPGRRKRKGRAAAEELDRLLPGWAEAAAQVVTGARTFTPDVQRLCVLAAQRHLQDSGPLLRRLELLPDDAELRFWVLVALAGTDTAEVRRAWARELNRACNVPSLSGTRAAWFAFARALVGSWLSWPEFRDGLAAGRALAAVNDGGPYRTALERLGWWGHERFAKWYRQVVYEVASQPDVALSLAAGGWIRDFPGAEYLFEALARVQEEPGAWWPLYLLRWTTDLPSGEPGFVEELRGFSPTALCLLSLVRPELAEEVAEAWQYPEHAEVIRWLLAADPTEALREGWCEEVLAPWAEEYYEVITVATGALCSLVPPLDFVPDPAEAPPRRMFLLTHFDLNLETLMDNFLCVLALREERFGMVEEEARRGRPSAIRALGVRPDLAERTVPLLLSLMRRGKGPARKVAETTLVELAARAGIPDLATLEERMDLASAWADGSEGGTLGRAWWSIGGYHLRLAVVEGAIRQLTYSGEKLLRGVPKEVRRDPAFAEVRQAREEASRRYRYLRGRLERAMEVGTAYRGADVGVLWGSPAARSLVAGLVLQVDGREFWWRPADPILEAEGPPIIAEAEQVAVAHPVALHQAGTLAEWQERMVRENLAQPFKQLFREIYTVGEGERGAEACERFADRPVNARQAFALLRGRGYTPGQGEAVKRYPRVGVRAHFAWARAEEPVGKLLGRAEAGGPVITGAIWFTAETGEPLALGEVPPILFSETLREADLTVSRAAFGEAGFSSEETRRLRALLIRHLTRALGLTTVYVSEDHAYVLIEGAHALYRLHLGSGSVLLERNRRHLDVSGLVNEAAYHAVLEGMDSITSHIVRTVLVLSRDREIAEVSFLKQLGVNPEA